MAAAAATAEATGNRAVAGYKTIAREKKEEERYTHRRFSSSSSPSSLFPITNYVKLKIILGVFFFCCAKKK